MNLLNDDEFNDDGESPHAKSAQEHKMHGNRLLAIRDYEGAINSFTDAIDLLQDALLKVHVDDLVSCLNNRAACFFILDRYEDAVLDASQRLKRYPHDHRAFHKRALMFERAGQLGKALEDYQSALNLEPNGTKVSLAVESLSANGVTTPEGFDNNLPFMHGCDQSSQDSDSDREDLSCDAESDDNDDETEGAPIHYEKGFIGAKIASAVVCTIDPQLLPKEGSYSIDGNRIMHFNVPSFVACHPKNVSQVEKPDRAGGPCPGFTLQVLPGKPSIPCPFGVSRRNVTNSFWNKKQWLKCHGCTALQNNLSLNVIWNDKRRLKVRYRTYQHF
jgi:hypothetical protein